MKMRTQVLDWFICLILMALIIFLHVDVGTVVGIGAAALSPDRTRDS